MRLAEGDKWQDVEYLEHTSLKTYMPYMMGGGYVLSADLAHVILGINQQVDAMGPRTGVYQSAVHPSMAAYECNKTADQLQL